MRRRLIGWPVLVALGVGATAFLVLSELRGYPWLLASLGGLAIGLLPFAAWRAVDQIRAAIASMKPPEPGEDGY